MLHEGVSWSACSRLVSLLTGWASSRLPWTKPEHRKIVIAASAFGNTNSALLMLVTAMCAQPALPFDKTLGGSCTQDVSPPPNSRMSVMHEGGFVSRGEQSSGQTNISEKGAAIGRNAFLP